jgi:hypothetical protein
MRRNFFLKHIIEGKMEGAGRRGRTHKQLLSNLNEKEDTGD